ncbi:MAG: hypothetical protein JXQ27_00660 [Acidobacteria bacterium]|nr:hypothetical protein [Acidobacteriota bacterium]
MMHSRIARQWLRSAGLVLLAVVPPVMGADPSGPVTGFLARFQKEYHVSSVTSTADHLEQDSLRLDAAGLQQATIHRLKSRRPVRPESNTHLRLALSVYVYEDATAAAAAFAEFRDTEVKTEEMLRSKAPLLALRRAAEIYLLDGSCMFSTKRMNAIQQELIRFLFPAEPPPASQQLHRRCGGIIVAPPD